MKESKLGGACLGLMYMIDMPKFIHGIENVTADARAYAKASLQNGEFTLIAKFTCLQM